MSQGFDPTSKPIPKSFDEVAISKGIHPSQTQQQNSVGLVGFVLSIVGIFTCGILCPIAMLISFFGLFKQPKGFAIAGTIIGFLGSVAFAAIAVIVIMTVFTVATTLMALGDFLVEYGARYSPLFDAQQAVAVEWADKEGLPSEDEGNEIIQGKLDMWGNQIIYETTGKSYSLRSAGDDGIAGNGDDVTLGPFRETKAYDITDIDSLPDDVKKELERQRDIQLKNEDFVAPGHDNNNVDGLPVSPLDVSEMENKMQDNKEEPKKSESSFGDLFKKKDQD